MGRPSRTGASTGPRAQVPSEPKKGRNTASASHADTRPVCRGAAREEVRTEAAASLGLGSPSGRTPWTSCPVTWLFGVETGGRPRCPGEVRRWGGPAAESSRSAPASLRRPESWEGGPGCRADFQARGGGTAASRSPGPMGPAPGLLVRRLQLPMVAAKSPFPFRRTGHQLSWPLPPALRRHGGKMQGPAEPRENRQQDEVGCGRATRGRRPGGQVSKVEPTVRTEQRSGAVASARKSKGGRRAAPESKRGRWPRLRMAAEARTPAGRPRGQAFPREARSSEKEPRDTRLDERGARCAWGPSAAPRRTRTRFLGNALFSLRPWRVSLDGEGPADALVSMCSAFSMSKASNFSMT